MSEQVIETAESMKEVVKEWAPEPDQGDKAIQATRPIFKMLQESARPQKFGAMPWFPMALEKVEQGYIPLNSEWLLIGRTHNRPLEMNLPVSLGWVIPENKIDTSGLPAPDANGNIRLFTLPPDQIWSIGNAQMFAGQLSSALNIHVKNPRGPRGFIEVPAGAGAIGR